MPGVFLSVAAGHESSRLKEAEDRLKEAEAAKTAAAASYKNATAVRQAAENKVADMRRSLMQLTMRLKAEEVRVVVIRSLLLIAFSPSSINVAVAAHRHYHHHHLLVWLRARLQARVIEKRAHADATLAALAKEAERLRAKQEAIKKEEQVSTPPAPTAHPYWSPPAASSS